MLGTQLAALPYGRCWWMCLSTVCRSKEQHQSRSAGQGHVSLQSAPAPQHPAVGPALLVYQLVLQAKHKQNDCISMFLSYGTWLRLRLSKPVWSQHDSWGWLQGHLAACHMSQQLNNDMEAPYDTPVVAHLRSSTCESGLDSITTCSGRLACRNTPSTHSALSKHMHAHQIYLLAMQGSLQGA